jgi:hypothetical protein
MGVRLPSVVGLDTNNLGGAPLRPVDFSSYFRRGQGWGVSVIESGEFPVILNSGARQIDRVSVLLEVAAVLDVPVTELTPESLV